MSWRTSCTFFKIVQKVYKLELRVWKQKEGARGAAEKKNGVQEYRISPSQPFLKNPSF